MLVNLEHRHHLQEACVERYNAHIPLVRTEGMPEDCSLELVEKVCGLLTGQAHSDERECCCLHDSEPGLRIDRS